MTDIAKRVKRIVIEHLDLDVEDVADTADFVDDLGADSLDVVELSIEIETEFDVDLTDDEIDGIATVRDAIAAVEAHVGERRQAS